MDYAWTRAIYSSNGLPDHSIDPVARSKNPIFDGREAGLLDVFGNLADADGLAREDPIEIDLAPANAWVPAVRHREGAVVEGISGRSAIGDMKRSIRIGREAEMPV